MKHSTLYVLLMGLFILSACDIKKNKEYSPNGFFKIYDDENYTSKFTPLDIEQTADEGYLILSNAVIPSSSFPGIYIMKIDKSGTVQYTKLLSDTYVSAVPNLIRNGNAYYVVCMDRLNLGTYILQLDPAGAETQTAFFPEMQYPLSADADSQNPSRIIIQHYNQDDKLTFVSSVTASGQLVQSRAFSIGIGDYDVSQPVINHLTENGKQFPFQCGRLSNNTFFFNGFYNYTFSLCMFDYNWDEEDEPAVAQGYRDERCISSVVPLSSNAIAGSRFAYGSNYILPYAEVPVASNTFTTSSDLSGYFVPELVNDAPVCLKLMQRTNKALLVYASTTKNGQILLLAYDASSRKLVGTKYIGETNSFKMAGLTNTSDNGIAVLATTEVAGRFSRIAVFKLEEKELDW